jgi:hypothetical protein
MNRLIYVFFAVIVGLLAGCSSEKLIYKDIKMVAWNEDTVNNYEIVFTKKNRFFYTIIHKDNLKESKEEYTGKLSHGTDRIYLLFNGARPVDQRIYLVKEASGNYLIQYFTNDKKRIFLRLQHYPHFFW